MPTTIAQPIWQELAIQRHTREAVLRAAVGERDTEALAADVARALDLPVADVLAVVHGMIESGDLESSE